MQPRTFELQLKGIDLELRVAALTGRESLSAPYRFDLDVVLPPELDPESLLRRDARLWGLTKDGPPELLQ